MAIATALREFNDPGHSVAPTFLSRDRFLFYNDLHIVQTWTETQQGKQYENSRFLSTEHRIVASCDCKVRETMVAKFEVVL